MWVHSTRAVLARSRGGWAGVGRGREKVRQLLGSESSEGCNRESPEATRNQFNMFLSLLLLSV